MKEITAEELKEIQMSLLDYFDEFCNKNRLKYTLACGTLLGAVRHKGYIPWDDDIDVYMERDDYDKLLSLYNNNENSHIKLMSIENNPSYSFLFAKLVDDRTSLIEDYNIMPIGVNIDIFPLDSIEHQTVSENKINKRLSMLKAMWLVKVHHVSKRMSIVKNGALIIAKLFTFPFSMRYLAQKINELAKSNNSSNHKYMFELSMNSTYKKGFKRESFGKTIDIEFEGKYYKAMSGYDEYLTASFGDYMQLPPVEDRVTHHFFKAYWIN